MMDPIASILGSEYKKPFMLIAALAGSAVIWFTVMSSAERVIDGRIDSKLMLQKAQLDDHEKRLTKLEENLGSMREVLSEIRADVKVLRVQLEK